MSADNDAVLLAIQSLRSDVIHELQEQRKLWGEAEATLLAQGKLHRERLDKHDAELGGLKIGLEHEANTRDARDAEVRTKVHDLRNKLQPLFTDVEELKRRMDHVERLVRKDTEMPTPPAQEPDG